MERHFEKELKTLNGLLERMGGLVEQSLEHALLALWDRDPARAQKPFQNERIINALEIEIDHRVADFFALFQPVAGDLRFLLAIIHINADLERLGDHAVNIAQSAVSFHGYPHPDGWLELPAMADTARAMLRGALQAFFVHDFPRAREVLESDDRIDDLNKQMTSEIAAMMKADPAHVEAGMELLRISKNLERIGDLSTNIAEETIFHVQALVVKHNAGEPGRAEPAKPRGERGPAA